MILLRSQLTIALFFTMLNGLLHAQESVYFVPNEQQKEEIFNHFFTELYHSTEINSHDTAKLNVIRYFILESFLFEMNENFQYSKIFNCNLFLADKYRDLSESISYKDKNSNLNITLISYEIFMQNIALLDPFYPKESLNKKD